jgi:hypothetical protein
MPHYNIQPGKRPPVAGTEPRLINSPGTERMGKIISYSCKIFAN